MTMRIETINLYRITIPFHAYFSISHVERRSSTRIVVEVVGGEGDICPSMSSPHAFKTERPLRWEIKLGLSRSAR
jgi:hypothetical protein